MDIRFMRRASVGLMVRAPSPVATFGIADCLLFPAPEDGDVVLPGVPLLLLVLPCPRDALSEDRCEGSGVLDGVRKLFPESHFEFDMAFDAELLVFAKNPGSSPPLLSKAPFAVVSDCMLISFCSLLDLRAPTLGRLREDLFSDPSGSMKVPGPIDFRGAFVFVLEFALMKEFGGKWLCRRLFKTGAAALRGIDSDLDEFRLRRPGAVFCWRASEFFLPIDPVPDTFLVAAGGLTG